MKTAQKELIAKRQEIEEKLQTILYEDEKLELLYCGRHASAYALIRRKDGMYYSFRFSDHKTTPYYSSKTFDIYAPITSEVLRNIRETLDKVSWCPFTLYDYLTLRTIYYFNNLRQPFCIDNTMNIFVGNKIASSTAENASAKTTGNSKPSPNPSKRTKKTSSPLRDYCTPIPARKPEASRSTSPKPASP